MRFLSALFFLFCFLAAAPVRAGGDKVALRYRIYAGGFEAMTASLTMDLKQKSYDLRLEAATEGFIARLFPWQASFQTQGRRASGRFIPNSYHERSSWRSGVKVTDMTYGPDGRILKTVTQADGKTTTTPAPDALLSRNAVDLLTGALVMLQSAGDRQSCRGRFPIFDGKRRFDIALTDGGADVIAPSSYSSFQGQALRCTLRVEPVAGFKDKDKTRGWMAVQNHTEARHMPPTLWLARLAPRAPVVPVRMEIASDYGSVVAHLASGL